jgi:hypothetical protein
MCKISEGEIALLLPDGKVRLEDGSVHYLRQCELLPGARLLLGVREYTHKKKKPPIKGVYNADRDMVDFEISPLVLKEIIVPKKDPLPPQVSEPESNYLHVLAPITIAALAYLFKKVAGLDNKLTSGSCEVKHQVAMDRIAKLEGKVLRKQIIDGGKLVKEKISKDKKD